MEKRKGIRNLVLLILFSLFILFLFIFQLKTVNVENIHNGVLDLSSWDYKNIITTEGNVEFYWDRLLTENNFMAGIEPDCMPIIPSVWNYYKLNTGIRPTGMGYATYRIHVVGAKPGQALAMRVQPFSTAYDLFIDNDLVASCGKVGTSESGSHPYYAIKIFEFTPKSDHFDIIVQISNYTYARGGFWYPIDIGTPDKIHNVELSVFGCDIFVIGFFILMIIYNLFYCILRRDKFLILFIVMCLMLLCRSLILGTYIFNYIFPNAYFSFYIWLCYIPIISLPSLYLYIVYHYFNVKISIKVIRLSMAFSASAMAAAFVLPTYLFTQLTYIITAYLVIVCFYTIYKLMKALISEYTLDILFMTIGVVLMSLCTFRDIMFYQNILGKGRMDYSPFGCVALILLWDMSITYRYEQITRDRLRALQELNISNEREKNLELRFLKLQIRPHFINNALNTIISVSRTDIDRARVLLLQFSKYLRGRYDYDNIDDIIPIHMELENIRAYLDLEKARYGSKLHIEYSIDSTEIAIPPLVLQPLVENAVVHGTSCKPEGMQIHIYVQDNGSFYKIGVKDNGEGMNMEAIDSILKGASPGSGIALNNINERLKKLYNTGLNIVTPEDGGLDIFMLIPKERGA